MDNSFVNKLEQKTTNPSSSASKPRVEWIDLAKGVCIVLVVITHVFLVSGVSFWLDSKMTSIRMPLYFILSGLFFKQYEGFKGFLTRKTNKLLIPFLFFFIVTSVLGSWVIYHDNALSAFWYDRRVLLNGPIWFLLCLFVVNIIFYLVQMFADHFMGNHKVICVVALSLLCGCMGLALSYLDIKLPFFIDSALTAIPLFAFGWFLFRHTNFLTSKVNYKRDVVLLVICVLIFWFLSVYSRWMANVYPKDLMWRVYLPSIAGPFIVLLLAKMVGRIPLISYWGRYSIIILCTHLPVARIVYYLLSQLSKDNHILMIPVFLITMLICHILIPVFRKYLPYVTAQEDLLRIKQ